MHTLFGKQLLKERKKRGYTTEKLARACGISRSYITLIENGRRLPGRSIIPKLAAALQIETGTVLNWYLEDISQRIQKELKIS